MSIKTKTSQYGEMEIAYDGTAPGEILITNEEGITNFLPMMLFEGEFQILVSGNSLDGDTLKAEFNFPDLTNEFEIALKWYADHRP